MLAGWLVAGTTLETSVVRATPDQARPRSHARRYEGLSGAGLAEFLTSTS